jgi:hypothetical protein
MAVALSKKDVGKKPHELDQSEGQYIAKSLRAAMLNTRRFAVHHRPVMFGVRLHALTKAMGAFGLWLAMMIFR